jgi:AraC-like DNA-binding protein
MASKYAPERWLPVPARTPLGDLQLAGAVSDVEGINPAAPRVLGSFALVYFLKIDGYYWDPIRGGRELRSGDVLFILPELAHAYGPGRDGRWDQIYFVFNGPQFEAWRGSGLLPEQAPLLHLEPAPFWQRRFEQVIDPGAAAGPGESWRVLGRLFQLLTEIAGAGAGGEAREPWLERAERLLGEPGETGWVDPETAARKVGLGYETFRKRFARRIGVPPAQFQLRRRIDWACAALYHRSVPLKELAEELQFSDVFHFSKTFRHLTGLSPSEFRRRMRGS